MQGSHRWVPLAAVVMGLVTPGVAAACPRCDTAMAARSIVLHDQPARWLLIAVAPFVVIAVLGAAVHHLAGATSSPKDEP